MRKRRGAVLLLACVATGLVAASGAVAFGTFSEGASLSASGYVYQTRVADVTGDRIPDIVASTDSATAGQDGFMVYAGTGGGHFSSAGVLHGAGSGTEGVAVGRFDSGKRLDVALSDYLQNSITLYYGQQSGGFTTGPSLDGATGTFLLEAADMNGDKRKDLVSINYAATGSTAISVFLRKPGGSFATRVDYPAAGTYEHGLAVGRIDGDKHPDVVAQASEGVVSVYLGKPNGTLEREPDVPVPGGGSYNNVALGDFDGDHKTDLAAADYDDDTLSIFHGKGNGRFALPPKVAGFSGDFGPEGIATGDFNRDGKLDLAAAGYTTTEVRVLLGRGNGKFKSNPKRYPESAQSYGLAAARLNSDKGLDLVEGTDSTVEPLINKKKP